MIDWKKRFGVRWGTLSQREQVILLLLAVLLAAFGLDAGLSKLYFEPRNALCEAVQQAEEELLHHDRILSREDWIHAEYSKLGDPIATVPDSLWTETEILKELAELSGRRVKVTTVVPRLGLHEGQRVTLIALDCEGPLEDVVEYLRRILNELPAEVNSLSLAPRTGGVAGVICRTSLRIECRDA